MPTHCTRNRAFLALAAVLATAQLSTLHAQATQTAVAPATASLPTRLSDAEFWKLVTDISEPGGFFRMADNFVSNERDIGTIAGMIRANGPTGGVYMGVGPEQNLTYIAAVRPKMVFIVDIRRQAVMHHLLYKAIFELSKDRADFISLLFARPRPAGLDTSSTILQIWQALALVPMNAAMATSNLARFREHLTKTHGFTLTPEELDAFDHVFNSFVTYGPEITTNGPGRSAFPPATSAAGSGGAADSASAARYQVTVQAYFNALSRTPISGAVNFIALTAVTDAAGQFNSFLGSEDNFRFLKDLHTKNLFVPNSGNFGGPKAIRAVGSWVKERGAIVTAFYVSNVEQYLFTDGIATNFYENVATLPVDEKSVFIRPGGFRMNTALCPIASLLRAAAAGRVFSNNAAVQCVQ